tara:strand:+ start:852 stop:1286 length:435 start_codon:yes stop_codon:yes gene_type:complete
MNKRYMVVILGSSKGVSEDLNNVADSDTGINFVDGSGIFIGTFYSPYSTSEIHTFLVERQAFMLFDITDKDYFDINLPTKYYEGLFPEINTLIPKVVKDDVVINDNIDKNDGLTSVNEIIDKLEKNKFDRNSLTKKEQDILDNC